MNCENPDCDQSLPDYFGSYGYSGRKRKYCNARCRATAYRRKRGIERKIIRQITVHADEILDIILMAGAYHNEKARKELLHLMHRHGLRDYLDTIDWTTRKARAKVEAIQESRRAQGLD